MASTQPTCPTCHSVLTLGADGELNTWKCPDGHGLGMVLHEAYGVLQDDEIAQLWQRARADRIHKGPRTCPMCALGMTPIELTYDDDEVHEGEAGDTSDDGSMWLDVCEPCQLIWFDEGELATLPADLKNPEPAASELAAVARIRDDFGGSYQAVLDSRVSGELTEKIYRRIPRIGRG